MYDKEDGFYFGFENYVDSQSKFIGKNESVMNGSPNKEMFEKIEDIKYDHHKTELNKDEKKPKDKIKIKHKNSISGNSSNNLINVLQKKKNRDDGEKTKKKTKKKTKSEMDSTLKYKSELNLEAKKKDNEKKIYEMFNNEEPFLDLYKNPEESSGDLFDIINNDNANVEVSQKKQIYNTQVNKEIIPETFNMILSSENNN